MSETQSLYYSRGVTPNQVYTDSSLLSELNANVQGISLPIAVSSDDVQVGENYYYALKAYPTTDLTGEGYTVKDSNSGLPLYVGYFAEGNDKIVTIDENGTLTELDTELINTQSGTVSIAPTPSTATVVINGEVRSDITAAVGTTVSYTVFKDGYVTVEDTVTITSGTNLIPVELEEASSGGGVALMVNYHPSSATVAINGTNGNIAVVPTNSPTTITASATGYLPFTPITKTYSENTIEDVYLYRAVNYSLNAGGSFDLPYDTQNALKNYFNGMNWKFEANLPAPEAPTRAHYTQINLQAGNSSLMGLMSYGENQFHIEGIGDDNESYSLSTETIEGNEYLVEYPTKIEIEPTSVEMFDPNNPLDKGVNVRVKLTITNIRSSATRVIEVNSSYNPQSSIYPQIYADSEYGIWNFGILYEARAGIQDSYTSESITGSAILYYYEE